MTILSWFAFLLSYIPKVYTGFPENQVESFLGIALFPQFTTQGTIGLVTLFLLLMFLMAFDIVSPEYKRTRAMKSTKRDRIVLTIGGIIIAIACTAILVWFWVVGRRV